jgi:hypothetical protein
MIVETVGQGLEDPEHSILIILHYDISYGKDRITHYCDGDDAGKEKSAVFGGVVSPNHDKDNIEKNREYDGKEKSFLYSQKTACLAYRSVCYRSKSVHCKLTLGFDFF